LRWVLAIVQLDAVGIAHAGIGQAMPHHHHLAAALQQRPQRFIGAG
jgi:hypothetical protein